MKGYFHMIPDPSALSVMTLFSDLNSGELEKIASMMNSVQLLEGEVFFEACTPCDNFFIVLSGNHMVSFSDGRAVTLNAPGDFIGLDAVEKDGLYRCSATALTRGEVFSLKTELFNELADTDPGLYSRICFGFKNAADEKFGFLKT